MDDGGTSAGDNLEAVDLRTVLLMFSGYDILNAFEAGIEMD